jgi:hypothetical protein
MERQRLELRKIIDKALIHGKEEVLDDRVWWCAC